MQLIYERKKYTMLKEAFKNLLVKKVSNWT